jgi:hypothetical protein
MEGSIIAWIACHFVFAESLELFAFPDSSLERNMPRVRFAQVGGTCSRGYAQWL